MSCCSFHDILIRIWSCCATSFRPVLLLNLGPYLLLNAQQEMTGVAVSCVAIDKSVVLSSHT